VITLEEKISTDEIKATPAETVESDEELTRELEEEKFTAVKGDDIEGGEIKACVENDIKPEVTEQTSTEKETEKSKETTSEKEFVEESNTKVDIKIVSDFEEELATNIVHGESGACSLEATCESPTDDLNSDRGSEEGGISTDEGIVGSDEDDKEEKSDFEKVTSEKIDKNKNSRDADKTETIES